MVEQANVLVTNAVWVAGRLSERMPSHISWPRYLGGMAGNGGKWTANRGRAGPAGSKLMVNSEQTANKRLTDGKLMANKRTAN